MKQQTLAMASGFERYGKKTRRTLFLEEMEQVVPWSELCGLIEPVYAKAGNGDRRWERNRARTRNGIRTCFRTRRFGLMRQAWRRGSEPLRSSMQMVSSLLLRNSATN